MPIPTLNHCIICYKIDTSSSNVPATLRDLGNNSELCRRFCTLSGRYLDLHPRHFQPKRTLNSKLSINMETVCEDCRPLTSSFCDLYDQLENIKIQLNLNIANVSAMMNYADEPDSPHSAWRLELSRKLEVLGENMERLNEFRAEFTQAATKLNENFFPQVLVKPLIIQPVQVEESGGESESDNDSERDYITDVECSSSSDDLFQLINKPSQRTKRPNPEVDENQPKNGGENSDDSEGGSLFIPVRVKKRKTEQKPIPTESHIPPSSVVNDDLDSPSQRHAAQLKTGAGVGGSTLVYSSTANDESNMETAPAESAHQGARVDDVHRELSNNLSDCDYEELVSTQDRMIEMDDNPQPCIIEESTVLEILQVHDANFPNSFQADDINQVGILGRSVNVAQDEQPGTSSNVIRKVSAESANNEKNGNKDDMDFQ